MVPADSSRRPVQRAAVYLVTGSAIAGIIACVFGAIQWGLLGLGIGLVGAWILFLIGLCALYRREQRAREEITTETVEPAGEPVKGPDPAGLR